MSAKLRDRLGSILMLAFVAALWVQRDYITPFGGIFPDIVMIGLALLAVLTLILSFTPWRAFKEEASKEEKPKEEKAERKNWIRMVVVALILLTWTGLLRYLGFALTGVLGFGGTSWYLSERRTSPRAIITSFLIAAAITYLLIYIFEHLLLVPLPKGTLFE